VDGKQQLGMACKLSVVQERRAARPSYIGGPRSGARPGAQLARRWCPGDGDEHSFK
jgi:hypothetical protein